MKLHICGASGSGVTTTGRLLADKLGIQYFDSDDYFWISTNPPFIKRRSSEERNGQIQKDLNQSENWILGGSVIDWGEHIFPDFDLIIFLYLPHEIRIERLRKRELEKYGNIIYTNETRRKQFNDFIAWAKDYDHNTGIANRTLKKHEAWLKKTNARILKIIGNHSVDERLQIIYERLIEDQLIN